jgi:hypothetical protein
MLNRHHVLLCVCNTLKNVPYLCICILHVYRFVILLVSCYLAADLPRQSANISPNMAQISYRSIFYFWRLLPPSLSLAFPHSPRVQLVNFHIYACLLAFFTRLPDSRFKNFFTQPFLENSALTNRGGYRLCMHGHSGKLVKYIWLAWQPCLPKIGICFI